jgi:Flp pilus assembly protein TadD
MNETDDAPSLRARAAKLTNVGRAAEALPLLMRAMALAPQDAGTLSELARTYLELTQFDEALCHAEAAIAAAPQAEWGHRLRAITLMRTGKNRDALISAQESARLAPNEPMALHALVDAQIECNQLGFARKTALCWLELAPEDANCRDALGRIALNDRNAKEAEGHFRDALTLNPVSARIMSNLGVALGNQNRKSEALDCYDRAAKMDPTFEPARRNTHVAVKSGTPGLGLLGLLGGAGLAAYGLIRLLERHQARKSLSPEMREYLTQLDRMETRRTWKIILFLCTFPVVLFWTILIFYPDTGSRPDTINGWLIYAGFCIGMISSLRWIWRERRRD